jgi:multiple sugar transport system substrate-binding protein
MNLTSNRAPSALAGVTALLVAATAGPVVAAEKPFEGVTVNVVTFTGPQIAEPLQRRAPDFAELTGAKVQVITVPFSDLYNKLLTDFATGTNSYDATVLSRIPLWTRPTRLKAAETLAKPRIPAFTRRVRQDSAT